MPEPAGYFADVIADSASTFRTWQANLARRRSEEAPQREMYAVLRAYYLNNALYQDLARALYELGVRERAIRGLRNPANRIVEFYAGHIWPGMLPDALPIVTTNDRLRKAIQQVWAWSNWGQKKQVFSRNLAMLGDQYIKVVDDLAAKHIYFQLLDPASVVKYQSDARGYATWVRIDVLVDRSSGTSNRTMCHTEVWDRAAQTERIWLHSEPWGTALDRLPQPTRTIPFSDMGIDFIPISHAKFRDIGDEHGIGAYALALDKIDEVNRQATRLHQMLYRHNNVVWALQANGTDAMNRPIAAPVVPRGALGAPVGVDSGQSPSDPNMVKVGDDWMIRLPGNASLQPLVPSLDYDAAISAIDKMMFELGEDLPELAYSRLRDMGEISGKAVRLLLSDAVDRVIEVRGNAETCLTQANMHAVTMGQVAGYWNVGDYDAGQLFHTFAEREVIKTSKAEEAETETAEASAKVVKQSLGVSNRQLLLELGYTQEQIDQFDAERGSQDTGTALLDAFDKGQ